MTELVLYYRDYCHLCEQLAGLLNQAWPERFAETELRNVDSRPDWQADYGQRVPVLLAKQQVICELAPDLDALKRYFGEPANPL